MMYLVQELHYQDTLVQWFPINRLILHGFLERFDYALHK